jgi:hypothetical protein
MKEKYVLDKISDLFLDSVKLKKGYYPISNDDISQKEVSSLLTTNSPQMLIEYISNDLVNFGIKDLTHNKSVNWVAPSGVVLNRCSSIYLYSKKLKTFVSICNSEPPVSVQKL